MRLGLRKDPARARVVFEVADSGPGVPPEQRETIFDAYLLHEGRTTRRLAGAGLGLAIAREFVHMHGGSIRITDAPEGGALFLVDLPSKAPPGTTVKRKGDLLHDVQAQAGAYALRAPPEGLEELRPEVRRDGVPPVVYAQHHAGSAAC